MDVKAFDISKRDESGKKDDDADDAGLFAPTGVQRDKAGTTNKKGGRNLS